MFKKKTVFIVGAGGSYDLGFPLGDGLKDVIAEKLDFRFKGLPYNERTKGDPLVLSAVDVAAQGGDAENYVNACRSIASAMPQAISIDNYLHTHSNEAKIVVCGKLGIAASILEAERNSKLMLDNSRRRIDFAENRHLWQNLFCQILTENIQSESIETIFDNVCFITFNYDRCIEHWMSHWLSNYFRIPLTEAETLASRLKIFHPYGQIGRLPWQTSAHLKVDFGHELDGKTLLEVSQQIRTFTERVTDQDMLSDMQNEISAAETIVFMGFSYGEMNMGLLKMNQPGPSKKVIGTAIGISAPNKEMIAHSINQMLGYEGTGHTHVRALDPVVCHQLLNDYWRVLTERPT